MSVTAFEKNIVKSCEMRTICEVLREIYWYTGDLVVREKVLEATSMAKKMDGKLRKYKKHWDKQDMWEPNEDAEGKLKQRQEQYEKENSDGEK